MQIPLLQYYSHYLSFCSLFNQMFSSLHLEVQGLSYLPFTSPLPSVAIYAERLSMSQLAPLLSVSPSRGLVDEKVTVLVENLPPGCPVTLHSLHLSEDNDYWEAFGHYVSNQRGVVSGGFLLLLLLTLFYYRIIMHVDTLSFLQW